ASECADRRTRLASEPAKQDDESPFALLTRYERSISTADRTASSRVDGARLDDDRPGRRADEPAGRDRRRRCRGGAGERRARDRAGRGGALFGRAADLF